MHLPVHFCTGLEPLCEDTTYPQITSSDRDNVTCLHCIEVIEFLWPEGITNRVLART